MGEEKSRYRRNIFKLSAKQWKIFVNKIRKNNFEPLSKLREEFVFSRNGINHSVMNISIEKYLHFLVRNIYRIVFVSLVFVCVHG